MSKISGTVQSKKGFYIGDICYVLSERVYDEIWGGKHSYNEGVYQVDSKNSFAVAGTAFGDGTYYDSYGNEYPVDAGVIGLVPLELVAKKDGLACGTVIESPGIAKFEAEGGRFSITLPDGDVIDIDTYDEAAEGMYYDE